MERAVRSSREVRRCVLSKLFLRFEVAAACSLSKASMLWSVKGWKD